MQFLKLKSKQEMRAYLPQVWALLDASYRTVPGGLHFASQEEVISDTDEWHLIVKDEVVLALTLHKYKYGLKLVALAKNRAIGAREALKQLIDHALNYGWMELSDQAESFVMRECNGHRFLIHASLASKLLKKLVEPASDDAFHYRRQIMNCVKTKLILGTPDFSQLA